MDDMISRQVARREQFGNSEHQDCSDCVNHGGDWDCDHVHCRKGMDTISRRAALDALGERPMLWTDDNDYVLGTRNQYDSDRLAIETLPSAQPEWTTDVNDILAYLDGVVHPLVSPENWNVYSELYDMVSGLLKPWEGR